MPFPLIWLIYAALSLVAAAALVLLAANLAQLSRTGGAIVELRDEIEKKAREMDVIRRNGPAAHPPTVFEDSYPPMAPVPAWPDASPVSPDAPLPPAPDDGGIEVIRNVRGAMGDVESSHLQQQTISMHPHHAEEQPAPPPAPNLPEIPVVSLPADEPLPEPALPPVVIPAAIEEPQPEEQPEEMPPLPLSAEADIEAEILDDDILAVVDETEQAAPVQAAPFVIPLFSPAKNDADFTLLWDRFKGAVDSAQPSAVLIDFSNVLFVYAKEAGYLEQLASIALQQSIPLRFIGLSTELRLQIAAWPTLSALILEN